MKSVFLPSSCEQEHAAFALLQKFLSVCPTGPLFIWLQLWMNRRKNPLSWIIEDGQFIFFSLKYGFLCLKGSASEGRASLCDGRDGELWFLISCLSTIVLFLANSRMASFLLWMLFQYLLCSSYKKTFLSWSLDLVGNQRLGCWFGIPSEWCNQPFINYAY